MDERSRTFLRRFFPGVAISEWKTAAWQMRHRMKNRAGLLRVFELSPDEEAALSRLGGHLPVGITPYYASRLFPDPETHPLRRTLIPRTDEFRIEPGEYEDPLGEEAHHPVPGLVHTYPDKALLLVTGFCATYCRYCMRSRLVGQDGIAMGPKHLAAAMAYIAAHPEIRDVILSGGDPLTLSDARLRSILEHVRAIPHVEIIRIGTKIPVVLPQRINADLCRMLKKFHPVFMSIHVIHPDELGPEASAACVRLADAGIPLGGQMVLLKGLNDDPSVMRRLVHAQLRVRMKPYYLHQCDAIRGSAHFRTSIQTGIDLIRSLHGHTSGYAVPHYMVDAPGGGGKVPLGPDYQVGREGDDRVLENYAGLRYRYRDPLNTTPDKT